MLLLLNELLLLVQLSVDVRDAGFGVPPSPEAAALGGGLANVMVVVVSFCNERKKQSVSIRTISWWTERRRRRRIDVYCTYRVGRSCRWRRNLLQLVKEGSTFIDGGFQSYHWLMFRIDSALENDSNDRLVVSVCCIRFLEEERCPLW